MSPLYSLTHALQVEDKSVVANYLPHKEMWRITFTFPTLNAAKECHLCVLGSSKAAAVREVLTAPYDQSTPRTKSRHCRTQGTLAPRHTICSPDMNVLGIESTCDETAAAVVQEGKTILSNVISSQIDLHRAFGGVVPELACRRHVDIMIPVIEEALHKASKSLNEIGLIAVACGPGLIGALLVGMQAAKTLAFAKKIPFVGVNHIEAHLYATLMSTEAELPAIGVILSGGHTTLLYVEEVGKYKLIGQTVDDAIGEAFDKTAKLLGLPYPGGPEIERLAHFGKPHHFSFKSGQVKTKPFSFSFSGLKTAVLYAWNKSDKSDQTKADIALAFRTAASTTSCTKRLSPPLTMAASAFYLAAAFQTLTLRKLLISALAHKQLFFPAQSLTLDNAAMIAGLGWAQFQKRGADPLSLRPLAQLEIT